MIDDRCTADQAQLLDRLVRSHVIKPDERARVLDRLSRGEVTVAQAKKAIDWLLRNLKKRKAAEKQRAQAERERNHNWLDMARETKAAGVNLMD